MSSKQNDFASNPRVLFRRTFGTALLAGIASYALPTHAQTIQHGGTLVFLIGSDPSSVNPVLTTASEVGDISAPIYECLTTVNREGVVVPLLAKSWTISSDGKTYDFQLNQAQWHDGTMESLLPRTT